MIGANQDTLPAGEMLRPLFTVGIRLSAKFCFLWGLEKNWNTCMPVKAIRLSKCRSRFDTSHGSGIA